MYRQRTASPHPQGSEETISLGCLPLAGDVARAVLHACSAFGAAGTPGRIITAFTAIGLAIGIIATAVIAAPFALDHPTLGTGLFIRHHTGEFLFPMKSGCVFSLAAPF